MIQGSRLCLTNLFRLQNELFGSDDVELVKSPRRVYTDPPPGFFLVLLVSTRFACTDKNLIFRLEKIRQTEPNLIITLMEGDWKSERVFHLCARVAYPLCHPHGDNKLSSQKKIL